jgi:enamine deaminase RidA (YjgF/YER057c/UK114 family)
MAGRIDARLQELGLELPQPPAAVAAYVPFTISGTTLFVAGQLPVWNGERRFIGKLGQEITVDAGREAARLCALNLLAQARAACGGDLDRVVRCLRLGGFVNCTPDFLDHPLVLNGASETMVQVLGEAGKHARVAVGAPSLPFNVAVEIDAIFELA